MQPPGDLPGNGGDGIGVVGEVRREEHRLREVGGLVDAPQRGLQRMDDVAA
jgi:hypothetical protein